MTSFLRAGDAHVFPLSFSESPAHSEGADGGPPPHPETEPSSGAIGHRLGTHRRPRGSCAPGVSRAFLEAYRMRTLVCLALLALLVTGAVLADPPAGIDRFDYDWTRFECGEPGCSGCDVYVPEWMPSPCCLSCAEPMDLGASWIEYANVPGGSTLLWICETTK